jgi:hypothetical protein
MSRLVPTVRAARWSQAGGSQRWRQASTHFRSTKSAMVVALCMGYTGLLPDGQSRSTLAPRVEVHHDIRQRGVPAWVSAGVDSLGLGRGARLESNSLSPEG